MNSSQNPVRVRFAPSPTGYLHVGGARTLLFNWLLAKKLGGTFVLRIENTDQKRSTPESEKMIEEDIRALGIAWDEGPGSEGPYGPYRQSDRMSLYAKHVQQLLDEGKAYYCFCSDELITQKRELALKMGKMPIYDGTCAKVTREKATERLKSGEKAGIRFRAPQKNFVLKDLIRGEIEFKVGTIGDFMITRTPTSEEEARAEEQGLAHGIGMPVYNFCCVIDDHLMEMSHIVRGEDHLSNTARQLMLYDAFGWKLPEFVHTSMVLGSDRQKLSKRMGDVSVHEYIKKGYLPEALINFLVLLGWWPSADLKPASGHPEIISVEELITHFEVDGFQKSPAVFDVTKLQWMNGFYIRNYPVEDIAARARPFFEGASDDIKQKISEKSDEWFRSLIETIRTEVNLLSELPDAAALFFEEGIDLADDAREILGSDQAKTVVDKLEEAIRSRDGDLQADDVGAIQKEVQKATGAKGKSLFMPIRAATTGKTHGPELKLILPLLGRQAVLERISQAKKSVQ